MYSSFRSYVTNYTQRGPRILQFYLCAEVCWLKNYVRSCSRIWDKATNCFALCAISYARFLQMRTISIMGYAKLHLDRLNMRRKVSLWIISLRRWQLSSLAGAWCCSQCSSLLLPHHYFCKWMQFKQFLPNTTLLIKLFVSVVAAAASLWIISLSRWQLIA